MSASGIDFESVDGTETLTETVVVSIFELSYRIVQDTEVAFIIVFVFSNYRRITERIYSVKGISESD